MNVHLDNFGFGHLSYEANKVSAPSDTRDKLYKLSHVSQSVEICFYQGNLFW